MSTLPDPRTSADGQISGRIQHGPRPHSPAFMTGPRCWCVSFFWLWVLAVSGIIQSSFGICLSSAHGDCPAVFCSPAYLLLLYPLGTWEWRGWRNMVFFSHGVLYLCASACVCSTSPSLFLVPCFCVSFSFSFSGRLLLYFTPCLRLL